MKMKNILLCIAAIAADDLHVPDAEHLLIGM